MMPWHYDMFGPQVEFLALCLWDSFLSRCCPQGGLPISHHNEIRDLTATLFLTEVCYQVQLSLSFNLSVALKLFFFINCYVTLRMEPG